MKTVNIRANLGGNVLENADKVQFISIFCQRMTVICVTFCYTAGK